MARRALVFRAGSLGLVCAGYEVEFEGAGQDRPGSMHVVRDCTALATEVLEGPDGSQTGLCQTCHDLIAASQSVGRVMVQRPRNN